MIFKPLNYEKFAQKTVDKLKKSQSKFVDKYQTDNFDNWFYNQSSETLRLYSDNKEVYFKYIPVGTFSQKTKTWLWAWANENSIEVSKFETLKVKKFGENNNYENLINAHFEGDEFTGWELTAIAFDKIKAIGTYRIISENLEKYFLLTKIITKEEIEKIESNLIECSLHGKIRKAFVCQHLNTKSITGFEEAFETFEGMKLEDDDDLQAWCSECEKERLKTDGWNNISMEFAKIKLVCEKCYFELKKFNLNL